MRILVVHNHYQLRGGEDAVFERECALLRSRGHDVTTYTVHNDAINGMSQLQVATAGIWNRRTYAEIRDTISRNKIELVHFQNIFPLISPSAYYAAARERVAVVQTLHNFRLHCLNGAYFRDGKICESCLGPAGKLPGLIHGCYRNNRVASIGVASITTFHRWIGTWSRMVGRYIALSEFSRSKLIQGGLPADKISVKPNFVDIGPLDISADISPEGSGRPRTGALYVGRLESYKGIDTLINACIKGKIPLRIIGDGPARPSDPLPAHIEMLGFQSQDEVYREMQAAEILVLPSMVYENFPAVIAEANAHGLPVVGTNHGAIAEAIEDGVTGRLFRFGDEDDLLAKLRDALSDPDPAVMRKQARLRFEALYSADVNYTQLMKIYSEAQALV